METTYTRQEIAYRASKMVSNDVGSFAYLKYVDRVDIWKQNRDGLYRIHNTTNVGCSS